MIDLFSSTDVSERPGIQNDESRRTVFGKDCGNVSMQNEDKAFCGVGDESKEDGSKCRSDCITICFVLGPSTVVIEDDESSFDCFNSVDYRFCS